MRTILIKLWCKLAGHRMPQPRIGMNLDELSVCQRCGWVDKTMPARFRRFARDYMRRLEAEMFGGGRCL
jgi:hypothetical protein